MTLLLLADLIKHFTEYIDPSHPECDSESMMKLLSVGLSSFLSYSEVLSQKSLAKVTNIAVKAMTAHIQRSGEWVEDSSMPEEKKEYWEAL